MLVVDSSALVAIIFGEPEATAFFQTMIGTQSVVGAPTRLETHMVLCGRGVQGAPTKIDVVLRETETTVVPFDDAHAAAAVAAFDFYGKGNHPARLNFGDCMAYAVAKVAGCPLLYKGDDFARTDIASAR